MAATHHQHFQNCCTLRTFCPRNFEVFENTDLKYSHLRRRSDLENTALFFEKKNEISHKFFFEIAVKCDVKIKLSKIDEIETESHFVKVDVRIFAVILGSFLV